MVDRKRASAPIRARVDEPPSPWRGSRGIWTRVESSLPESKCQPSGEDKTDGDVVYCVVSGNASAGRTSAKDRGKGEILGAGQACKEVSCGNSKHTRMNDSDKRPTGNGNQVLVKVLLEVLERGQTTSTRARWREWSATLQRECTSPKTRHDGGC